MQLLHTRPVYHLIICLNQQMGFSLCCTQVGEHLFLETIVPYFRVNYSISKHIHLQKPFVCFVHFCFLDRQVVKKTMD